MQGRPYDKKTGTIKCDPDTSVDAVVRYLERKLRITFAIPAFPPNGDKGIKDIDTSINHLIQDLRNRKIGGIYLPNTRWFSVRHDDLFLLSSRAPMARLSKPLPGSDQGFVASESKSGQR